MRKYIVFLVCCILALLSNAQAKLTIANKGTPNATLVYDGKPMLKVGPLPEVAVFAVELGSSSFDVEQWLDWMARYGMGYGRVYPESSFNPWQGADSDKRVYPFDVVRWDEGRPIVDLTRFNRAYWDNFAKVVKACADRGIILHIQLYQRVFFELKSGNEMWKTNYFYPENNINGYPMTNLPTGGKARNGYWIWHAMATQPDWRRVHKNWVEHVLDAVGNNGNALIDLMNEANFKHNHMTREWIEYTLDIIEEWEERTGNDILVGMDFDHWYKRKDPGIEYVLAHPRMELIICEGAEGHVNKNLTAGDRKPLQEELAILYRQRYRKPIVSANSPTYWPDERREDGLNPKLSNNRVRQYQWESMMLKVQGVGVYAKTYPLDFGAAAVRRYASETQQLMDFFEGLDDYVALEISPEIIADAPAKYRRALQSPEEVVVYLHTDGFEKKVEAGKVLELCSLAMKAGPASIDIVHPGTGETARRKDIIRDGKLSVELPGFHEDVAVHIVSSTG